jgi:nitrite reductase/ring-hydroxylating ferredoxin subunit
VALKQIVCDANALEPGEMVSTMLGPVPVVVIRTRSGRLYAMTDKCLHHGGPLSKGALLAGFASDVAPGEYRADRGREVVRCPWHGYEYDVKTGCMVVDSARCLQVFNVGEEDGHIVVST